MTRGQLPQRAGSLGLNGGGTAAAVPPDELGLHPCVTHNTKPQYSANWTGKPCQLCPSCVQICLTSQFRWTDGWVLTAF